MLRQTTRDKRATRRRFRCAASNNTRTNNSRHSKTAVPAPACSSVLLLFLRRGQLSDRLPRSTRSRAALPLPSATGNKPYYPMLQLFVLLRGCHTPQCHRNASWYASFSCLLPYAGDGAPLQFAALLPVLWGMRVAATPMSMGHCRCVDLPSRCQLNGFPPRAAKNMKRKLRFPHTPTNACAGVVVLCNERYRCTRFDSTTYRHCRPMRGSTRPGNASATAIQTV